MEARVVTLRVVAGALVTHGWTTVCCPSLLTNKKILPTPQRRKKIFSPQRREERCFLVQEPTNTYCKRQLIKVDMRLGALSQRKLAANFSQP